MKNSSLIYSIGILFVLSLFACNKDKKEETPFERGSLISYQTGGSYTKETLKQVFQAYASDLVNDVNYLYGVQMYSVEYQTLSYDGQESYASGLVVVPVGANKSLPLLSFEHGTVLNTRDVPSLSGSGKDAGLVYATEGYVASLPDFIGLGTGEGFHPYQHAKSEATAIIDMLIATQQLCDKLNIELNQQLFVTGYSQGGHAAMAALKMLQEEYSDKFTITAGAPMAGPYDMSGIMFDTIMLQKEYIRPSFLPYMLYSFNMIYGMYDDIHSVLKSPYNTLLDNYFFEGTTHTLSEVSAILPESRIPSDILKDEIVSDLLNNKNNVVKTALQDNDLYDWKPEFPIHLYHCGADKTVPVSNSEKAYNYFKEKGADVQFIIPVDSGTHVSCIVPAIFMSLEWFNSLKN